ncbi:hypothetical protein K492DRAFT_194020 [Lichtheimia hyalospora FSU 10163]|nr:hypothetical protein K492DRAFT_194020 [Lichtheimia hyalospora FSU 10163]
MLVIEERRSAVIPSQFSEIAKWIQIFGLLAPLIELVMQQQRVDGLLRDEHTGITQLLKALYPAPDMSSPSSSRYTIPIPTIFISEIPIPEIPIPTITRAKE